MVITVDKTITTCRIITIITYIFNTVCYLYIQPKYSTQYGRRNV